MSAVTHLLVGEGRFLDLASATAQACGLDFQRLPLVAADAFNFDLTPLREACAPGQARVFVALDARAVNFARHTLIAQIRLAGYATFDLVSPRAVVDPDARLMGNVHVGDGSTIGPGAKIGPGSWLGRGVVLGDGVQLAACVTLGNGVVLGERTRIERGCTLGDAAVTPADADIGRHCEWLLPGALPARLPAGSFFDPAMPEGARILNGGFR